jgi:signal recognition particle GTPase
MGAKVASDVVEEIKRTRFNSDVGEEEIRGVLAEEVSKILRRVSKPLTIRPELKPHVILVAGVNGSGKTTTIGKLAQKYRLEGFKVMLAAGDTFRAAAIEQLKVWGERTGTPVIAKEIGADAAGLAYEAYEKARAEGYDVLLIDTAGRLQNKAGLMAELDVLEQTASKRNAYLQMLRTNLHVCALGELGVRTRHRGDTKGDTEPESPRAATAPEKKPPAPVAKELSSIRWPCSLGAASLS